MKRGKPLRRVSKKRAKEKPERDTVRQAVFERDGRCRLTGMGVGECFGPPTYHHIRKASQGGQYTVQNGAMLCAFHNGEIEKSAEVALRACALGLVKKSWE